MGAVALGPRVVSLAVGIHGSTFGGNPLACATSLATLKIISDEKLVERAAQLGTYFLKRLQEIESPLIREVRGLGLMIGIELKVRAMPLVAALADQGVQLLTAGTTILRLLPPLVISQAEIDEVVAAVAQVLKMSSTNE